MTHFYLCGDEVFPGDPTGAKLSLNFNPGEVVDSFRTADYEDLGFTG